MASYCDTSALAKLYHVELGSAVVERIVTQQSGACFASRLVLLEMQSVLALKLRVGSIAPADALVTRRRFRSDVRRRRFRVASLRARHYTMADKLIDVHGPSLALRTLDALHLALALDLQRNGFVDSIMTADRVLCTVAPLEGLPVINPEVATP